MDSMIKEINENLKAIIDTIKENLDNSINTLDNIQIQMDKKVEEAKKYKIQVDSAKGKIKNLEDENKTLELSLNELSEKYGKMNLVSLIEAGNREIKNKINDNLKEINKQKEHIAELTNRARTIKDLLINLKKDKTVKEERLENTKVIYNYYNDRINEIVDYAFNHSLNLADYKKEVSYLDYEDDDDEDNDVKAIELENTMVFDEIANIDENKNFKDEMTFINDQIDNTFNDSSDLTKIDEIIKKNLSQIEESSIEDEVQVNEEPNDTTQVFDTILNSELEEKVGYEDEVEKGIANLSNYEGANDIVTPKIEEVDTEYLSSLITNMENLEKDREKEIDINLENNPFNIEDDSVLETIEESSDNEANDLYNTLKIDANNNEVIEEVEQNEDKALDEENISRINKINDLFANFENNINPLEKVEPTNINGVEAKIDDAYKDIFGKPLDSDDLNKKEPTLTDIFGNPVNNDELSNESKVGKKLEELFVENGIDFNKFREDEKNYLKQIYDEEKFNNILNTLKRNKINLDNVYNSFNIFGEISANELENLINKLISVGQSVEAIGLVLEKLPKVKKYNLSDAIMSYGDYVKNIDITELIMKAKELYINGGNN